MKPLPLPSPYKNAWPRRDALGNLLILKRLIITLIGFITYPRLRWFNQTQIKGTEHLENLPQQGVLFVSNHQTYFADVIAMQHIFCSVKWGYRNSLKTPLYLLNARINTYFVAAQETMKSGLLPKLFSLAGSVSIKRTWREADKYIKREVDTSDIENIGYALSDGWVITFPQGTTKPFVPGRKGTAHLIKTYQPIVVPVVINGFRRAFDKKGLRLKKRNTQLLVTFKEPLSIDYNSDVDTILAQVMHAIEQSEQFLPKFRYTDHNPEPNNEK